MFLLIKIPQLYSIQNTMHLMWNAKAICRPVSLIVSAVAVLSLIIHQSGVVV